jgi:hypothetical protein
MPYCIAEPWWDQIEITRSINDLFNQGKALLDASHTLANQENRLEITLYTNIETGE